MIPSGDLNGIAIYLIDIGNNGIFSPAANEQQRFHHYPINPSSGQLSFGFGQWLGLLWFTMHEQQTDYRTTNGFIPVLIAWDLILEGVQSPASTSAGPLAPNCRKHRWSWPYLCVKSENIDVHRCSYFSFWLSFYQGESVSDCVGTWCQCVLDRQFFGLMQTLHSALACCSCCQVYSFIICFIQITQVYKVQQLGPYVLWDDARTERIGSANTMIHNLVGGLNPSEKY